MAAEAVCASDEIVPEAVLDLLTGLVDKSLVQPEPQPDGATRYRLLETVRQYASQQLELSDHAEAVRRQHARYFLQLAQEAEAHLLGAEQHAWMARLEHEHDNLRKALTWSLQDARDAESETWIRDADLGMCTSHLLDQARL